MRARVIEHVNLAMQHAASVARQLCPVSKGKIKKNGEPHMRDTIVLETYRDGLLTRLHVKANYSSYVELGHHTVDGTWVPAQPFVHPAIESAKQELALAKIHLA